MTVERCLREEKGGLIGRGWGGCWAHIIEKLKRELLGLKGTVRGGRENGERGRYEMATDTKYV